MENPDDKIKPKAETEAYKIKQDKFKDDDYCKCGHIRAAHGSNGFICAANTCTCRHFKLRNKVNVEIEGAD